MSESSEPQSLEELVKEVLAGYSSDPERQRALLLRLRLLELSEDPDVIAAQHALAQASAAELDAAFALAAQLGSFDPATAEARAEVGVAVPRRTAATRLAELARAVSEWVDGAVGPVRRVFEAKLAFSTGAKSGKGERVSFGPGATPSQLTFLVPTDLAVTGGLAAIGRVETGDSELRVFIARRNETSLPPLVLIVEAGDVRSSLAFLVVKEDSVGATVDWLTEDVPRVLRLGILEEGASG